MAFIELQQKGQGGAQPGCYPPNACLGHSSKTQHTYGPNIRSVGNKSVKAVCPFCNHVNKAAVFRELFWFSLCQRVQRFLPLPTPCSLSEIDNKNTDAGVDAGRKTEKKQTDPAACQGYKVLLVCLLL